MQSNMAQAFLKMKDFLERRAKSELVNTIIREDAMFLLSKMGEFLRNESKSQEGQSPEQDRLIEAAAKELMDSGLSVVKLEKIRQMATGEEPESTLTPDERLALAKTTVEEIVLRGTITKYKTFYDEERTEPRGWLLKLLDENDRETDDGNEWLCRIFVKWVQEIPREISTRDEHNKRDRSYPTRTKRSIYVNDGEMAFIEELSKEQGILVQEKEFVNQ